MDCDGQGFCPMTEKERARVVDDILEKIDVLPEDEKLQDRKDWGEFKEKTEEITSNAKKTAKSLRAIADRLDQVWWNYKAKHAAGTAACVAGGFLSLINEDAASLAFSAAGAVVNRRASTEEVAIRFAEIKAAEKLISETRHNYNALKEMIHNWSVTKETTRLIYIYGLAKAHKVANPRVLTILRELVSYSVGMPSGASEAVNFLQTAALNSGAKAALQGGAEEAAKAGTQATDDVLQAGAKTSTQEVSKSGAQAADDLVEAGSKTVGKFSKNFVVFVNTAFLVWDAIDLGFTINDLVKNKGSEAAKDLREKAKEIEDAFNL